MRLRQLLHVIYILLFTCFFPWEAFAQSYGLGFQSHETVQDKRTGLDLSPDKKLCFKGDFELAFDFAFLPNRENYFGYIVRLINNDKQNIDLLYDRRTDDQHFKLIIGDKISNILFNIDNKKLLSNWTKFRIKFDISKQQLTVFVGSSSYSQHVELGKNNCFKILYGSNDYLDFKTNDVPPMKLRDIKIIEPQGLTYNWLLDEFDGNEAHEQIAGNTARLTNPLWIKRMHFNWQPLKGFKVKGAASVAFNPEDETVYIVGSDSLISYSVATSRRRSMGYKSGNQYLLRGNQSYYSTNLKKLLNANAETRQVAMFDTTTKLWDLQHSKLRFETNYWHLNKFYSPTDSSLYLIGGYGQFLFKDTVHRYNVHTRVWEKFKAGGDVFTPRYLSALGATGDGAYIIGGYGSSTGQQILNPRNLYDLNYFDVKTRTFKKIYELNIKGEDFVFANSLVIDKKLDSYYALIFPKHKYNSRLQLIMGSLSKPEFKELGNQIPYTFHDISSYADLFYCPQSKRFIAVTLLLDEKDNTQVKLYSLYSPPIALPETVVAKAAGKYKLLWFLMGVAILIALLYLLYKRRKGGARVIPLNPVIVEAAPLAVSEESKMPLTPVIEEEEEPTTIQNAVFLFGDLQLFDSAGNDVTKNLTPLTKELFLIILLYTIRWGRGITSEKLKEILWFDKSAESARNNRSVNIAKLKNVLDKVTSCQIIKESGHWKIEMDAQQVTVDYKNYLDIVKDKRKLDKQKIAELARIIQRGNFLADVEYEWLDTFKSEISNEIIDTYLHFASSINVKDDPEFLIRLANYIFYFDPVNEEAMMLKCRSLISLGKHSIAKNAYDSFCREYKTIYGEEFEKNFNAVLE